MGDAGDGLDSALFGRQRELGRIRNFLESATTEGGALVMSGEPGVGKTMLLDAAATAASGGGTSVLRAAGAEFEADLSFSGLNQLLYPMQGHFERLDGGHRDALLVALGLSQGPPPARLLVSNAVLALLRNDADPQPILVVIDDLPWLDRPSALVLGFVARRLAGSRVGFIGTSRSEAEGFFERAGLPEHELGPLDDDAAATLLRARFPTLSTKVRHRVLAECQGNPLALLELPSALSESQRTATQGLPPFLPLTRRLEALFASRIRRLPGPTRQLLLASALEGTGDLKLIRRGAGEISESDDFGPAERARLVTVDESRHRFAFRHPLIRSTVVQLSTDDERRRTHRELVALVGEDQPERLAWHLGEATVGPDEEVAGILETASMRTLQRGDAVGAVGMMIRAADLSPAGPERGRRLADAAYTGAIVTGDLRNVPQLLGDARRADPAHTGSLEAAMAAAYLLLNGEGEVDTAHRVLVGAIQSHENWSGSEAHAVVEALYTLMLVCFFGGRDELWKPFDEAIARLVHVPEDLFLCSQTYVAPVTATAPVLERLDGVIADLGRETDPNRIVRIGIAAFYVDRLSGVREALWRIVRDGREGGALGSAINAVLIICFDCFFTGDWDEAHRLAREGVELCDEGGYRLFSWAGRYGQALLAAACGEERTAQSLTDQMTEWAIPRGAGAVKGYASHARGLAALGRMDYEDAYQQAASISPPGTLSAHGAQALWVTMDLVEAAVHTGRRAEASAHVAAMKEADIARLSPRLALLCAGAAAMATAEECALAAFEEALALPGADRWPFECARVQLAYGERLRRRQAISESREHLAGALETFQRLGAEPWKVRASKELRATGQTRSRGSAERDSLTPQELEIAQLAAAGLTNKQIGERLFLSHRTVGAHLYRVFPKLSITSRAALRDALGPPPSEGSDDVD